MLSCLGLSGSLRKILGCRTALFSTWHYAYEAWVDRAPLHAARHTCNSAQKQQYEGNTREQYHSFRARFRSGEECVIEQLNTGKSENKLGLFLKLSNQTHNG